MELERLFSIIKRRFESSRVYGVCSHALSGQEFVYVLLRILEMMRAKQGGSSLKNSSYSVTGSVCLLSSPYIKEMVLEKS